MKQSIEWHKKCLENSTRHAKARREQAEKELNIVKKLEQSNRLRRAQIALAIKEGKTGFDEDKYAIKRLCV